MASILDSVPEISDVVLYEAEKAHGHCRSNQTVLLSANVKVGTMVKEDGDATYSIVTDALLTSGITTDVGIVIDSDVYGAAAADTVVTILNCPSNGYAGIKEANVLFDDALTGTNRAVAMALLAANGIAAYTTV